jgi:Protein of unknown function (DUF3108)
MRLSFLLLFCCCMAFQAKDSYRRVVNTSFDAGEYFEYRVHYGLFNAAEATVEVAPQVQTINGRPCFHVNVVGKTLGAFGWFAKIRDQWVSWIDTSAIVSQKFYRNIRENDYRKIETVVFNHATDNATVTDDNGTKQHNVPNNIQDAISGYFFLRTVDFTKLDVGDVVSVPTFFENAVYPLKVRYRGKEVIKTKYGKLKALKLTPVIPDNQLFKGENSIRIWMSDDTNKVPVRVEVDLWVGSLVMEIRNYRNTRQDFKWF